MAAIWSICRSPWRVPTAACRLALSCNPVAIKDEFVFDAFRGISELCHLMICFAHSGSCWLATAKQFSTQQAYGVGDQLNRPVCNNICKQGQIFHYKLCGMANTLRMRTATSPGHTKNSFPEVRFTLVQLTLGTRKVIPQSW